MIDPLGLTLIALAAAYMLRNDLATSNRETAKETESARSESRAIASRLRSEVEGLRRRQALDVLHSTKRQYVEKSNTYHELMRKYGARRKKLLEEVSLMKSQKHLFYSTGRHGEIPVLKIKIDELYSVIDEVDKAFRQYKEQVAEFNSAVAEIKALIASYSR